MRLAALCGVLALTAATVSAQQQVVGKSDDPGIAKLRQAYQAAVGSQDAAAIAKLYAADGVEMPPNAPAQKGRAAIEAFHKAFAQQWMMHGMTLTPRTLQVWNGDTAYEVGSYKQSLMDMKGGGMNDDEGKYIVLLKKDAGSGTWLITHSIYNSDKPLPGAAKK